MKVTDYEGSAEKYFGMSKADFVRSVIASNFRDLSSNGRSINGGNIGNRHALKRGFRMWNYAGTVIDRGTSSVKRHEYCPDF